MANLPSDLTKLITFLNADEHFKANVIMPCDADTKKAAFKHKDGSWSWEKCMQALNEKEYTTFGILMKNILCFDFDTEEDFELFQELFPNDFTMRTPVEKTRKGYHVLFKRPESFDDAGIFDKAPAFEGFPKVDLKTVSKTGTCGLLIVAPSPNKVWLCAPWKKNCVFDYPSEALQEWMLRNYMKPKDMGAEGVDIDANVHKALTEMGFKDIHVLTSPGSPYTSFSCSNKGLNCSCCENVHDSNNWFISKRADGSIWVKSFSGSCKAKELRVAGGGLIMDDSMKLVDECFKKGGGHYEIAELVSKLHFDELRYNPKQKNTWYKADKKTGIWSLEKEPFTLRKLLSCDVKGLLIKRSLLYSKTIAENFEADKEAIEKKQTRLLEVAGKLSQSGFKESIINECKGLMKDDEIFDKMDTTPGLIGFNNGVYDLNAGEFRAARPEEYVCKTVGYDYVSDVSKGVKDAVKSIIYEPFADTETGDYVVKSLASTLDGHNKWQEFYIWTGSGANGKSTTQELVLKTLGEYGAPLDSAFWTTPKPRSGSAMPELADKKGIRCIFSNEPEATDKLHIGKIKEITGGEAITARALYQDPITFTPMFKVFFACNTIPNLSKLDGGIKRRIRVIPFIYQFKENPIGGQKKADITLLSKIRENIEYRQAFMQLLIENYRAHIKGADALAVPQSVVEASEEYITENNPVLTWLQDNYVITHDPKDVIKAADMFVEYSRIDRNMTQTAFGTAMTVINGVPKKQVGKSKIWHYVGIKLNGNVGIESDSDSGN